MNHHEKLGSWTILTAITDEKVSEYEKWAADADPALIAEIEDIAFELYSIMVSVEQEALRVQKGGSL